MKFATSILALATLALCIAPGSLKGASSYTVQLTSDLMAGGTQLKAGEYKVQVEGNQAVFKKGKETIQVPADVENSPSKFTDTTLESSGGNLQAIDIGGTTMKVVFKSPNSGK